MDNRLVELATRIAEALERLAPPPPPPLDLGSAEAFVWHPSPAHRAPVPRVSRVEMELLKGVERQKQILLDNTRRSNSKGLCCTITHTLTGPPEPPAACIAV